MIKVVKRKWGLPSQWPAGKKATLGNWNKKLAQLSLVPAAEITLRSPCGLPWLVQTWKGGTITCTFFCMRDVWMRVMSTSMSVCMSAWCKYVCVHVWVYVCMHLCHHQPPAHTLSYAANMQEIALVRPLVSWTRSFPYSSPRGGNTPVYLSICPFGFGGFFE